VAHLEQMHLGGLVSVMPDDGELFRSACPDSPVQTDPVASPRYMNTKPHSALVTDSSGFIYAQAVQQLLFSCIDE